MGLYDTIQLPEQLALPGYSGDTDPTDVSWQTKSLLCGQDEYRLRPLYNDGAYYVERQFSGRYQLERRVPPRQKQTHEGAFFPDDTDLRWWNTVRPSCDLEFYSYVGRDQYRYRLSLTNGVTDGEAELVEHTPSFFDENGMMRQDTYWNWFIDEDGEPTIYETKVRISDVVRALETDDPWRSFEDWDLDAGEVHRALEYYLAHQSEFSDVTVTAEVVREWMGNLADQFDLP